MCYECTIDNKAIHIAKLAVAYKRGPGLLIEISCFVQVRKKSSGFAY